MNEKRIEKKFVFGKYKEDFLEKILLANGFSKLYPSRYISSIYIDTLNFDFARQAIFMRYTTEIVFLNGQDGSRLYPG